MREERHEEQGGFLAQFPGRRRAEEAVGDADQPSRAGPILVGTKTQQQNLRGPLQRQRKEEVRRQDPEVLPHKAGRRSPESIKPNYSCYSATSGCRQCTEGGRKEAYMADTFRTNLLRARVPKQRQEEEERGGLLAQVPVRH